MKKMTALFFLFIINLIINNCSTIKTKYELIDERFKKIKSKSAESEFIIKENNKKGQWAELKSVFISGALILGELKERNNNDEILFNIDKIKFLTSWHNGYTQGEFSACGSIVFKRKGEYFESSVVDSIEIMDVIKGEIRYDAYYYKGVEGTRRFKNRITRITEVVKFLKTKNLKEFYGSARYKTKYGESFKNATETILFPELFGFKYLKQKNLLDDNFNLKDMDVTNDILLADEMIWHKSYTKKIFPEYLNEIRNSGSIWKDYEEALDIYFVLYNIDYFFNKIINKATWMRK